MRWRIYRLKQRIRAWLGVPSVDDFSALRRRVAALGLGQDDIGYRIDGVDDACTDLHNRLISVEQHYRLEVLRRAHADVEKVETNGDTAKSA